MYKDIIKKSLQNTSTTAIQIHKLDDALIMEIDYDIIVNSIIDDLAEAGYTINTSQQ